MGDDCNGQRAVMLWDCREYDPLYGRRFPDRHDRVVVVVWCGVVGAARAERRGHACCDESGNLGEPDGDRVRVDLGGLHFDLLVDTADRCDLGVGDHTYCADIVDLAWGRFPERRAVVCARGRDGGDLCRAFVH